MRLKEREDVGGITGNSNYRNNGEMAAMLENTGKSWRYGKTTDNQQIKKDNNNNKNNDGGVYAGVVKEIVAENLQNEMKKSLQPSGPTRVEWLWDKQRTFQRYEGSVLMTERVLRTGRAVLYRHLLRQTFHFCWTISRESKEKSLHHDRDLLRI